MSLQNFMRELADSSSSFGDDTEGLRSCSEIALVCDNAKKPCHRLLADKYRVSKSVRFQVEPSVGKARRLNRHHSAPITSQINKRVTVSSRWDAIKKNADTPITAPNRAVESGKNRWVVSRNLSDSSLHVPRRTFEKKKSPALVAVPDNTRVRSSNKKAPSSQLECSHFESPATPTARSGCQTRTTVFSPGAKRRVDLLNSIVEVSEREDSAREEEDLVLPVDERQALDICCGGDSRLPSTPTTQSILRFLSLILELVSKEVLSPNALKTTVKLFEAMIDHLPDGELQTNLLPTLKVQLDCFKRRSTPNLLTSADSISSSHSHSRNVILPTKIGIK